MKKVIIIIFILFILFPSCSKDEPGYSDELAGTEWRYENTEYYGGIMWREQYIIQFNHDHKCVIEFHDYCLDNHNVSTQGGTYEYNPPHVVVTSDGFVVRGAIEENTLTLDDLTFTKQGGI